MEEGSLQDFLAQKARAAAKKGKIDATIEQRVKAKSHNICQKLDTLCIGPHYEFRLNAFKDMAAPYNIPVIVIPEEIYSMLDGKALLELDIIRNRRVL